MDDAVADSLLALIRMVGTTIKEDVARLPAVMKVAAIAKPLTVMRIDMLTAVLCASFHEMNPLQR